MTSSHSILGHPVKRVEDPRFITGRGAYTDDIRVEGALHAAFVRAPLAHALVRAVDPASALAIEGVVAVYTAATLGVEPYGRPAALARTPLAADRVRYVMEPVALVLAETRGAAVDGATAVLVDYDPLPVVVDPRTAMADGAPLLFPDSGSNVCHSIEVGWDPDPLADAEVRITAEVVNQRLAPVPMETSAIIAVPEADGGLRVWLSTQHAHGARNELARVLKIEPSRLRVTAPDVGGGFGAKIYVYPEYIAVARAALLSGRPVRWTETRSENLTGMCHGRAQWQRLEIGATRDGRITGMRWNVVQDAGAYYGEPSLPALTHMMASGVYQVPKVAFRSASVFTNTTPIHAYRGAGRPEAAALIERTMDLLAARLGMDPVAIRRLNFIPKFEKTHETAVGTPYDVGDYAAALDRVLEISGYQALREEQRRRRESGDRKQLGIGLAVYVEITGGSPDSDYANLEPQADGTIALKVGTSSHGQGHETAYRQLVAAVLDVPFTQISYLQGDTATVARGNGTYGSRSLQIGGTAVKLAADAVRERSSRLAAHLLEADPADIVFEAGRIQVAGVPERGFTWAELVAAASTRELPEDLPRGLGAEVDFKIAGATFPFGAHVAVVEVDTETGDARLRDYFAVDDSGRLLNPLLADGQVHGGIAQGVAQALFETVIFDADGNPLTSSLLDYGIPSANELVEFVNDHTVTETFLNPLGAKGIGESGTIGSTPAVQNAVMDALRPLGVDHIDMPLSPLRVWTALRSASPEPAGRP